MHSILRTRGIINKRYDILKHCQSCHKCIHCISVTNIHTIFNNSSTCNHNAFNRPIVDDTFKIKRHKNNYYSIHNDLNLMQVRQFSLSTICLEKAPLKPSSQVEATVQELKKQKETPAATTPAKIEKKSLRQKIVDEILHYYHGFRLLFIDIKISSLLLLRVLNGKSLSRREYRLLTRTVGDLFRLVPFSVFIIVPFAELLLPVFIKFFPGMLPSTFQTNIEKDDKMKQSLKVKLEMAKFLQQTLDTMTVQHKERNSVQVKDFVEWFHKMRTSGEEVSTEDILKYSKLFEDEITLDSLTRSQLVALCRVLDVQTLGTNYMLRFQLRMKLRFLAADDKTIEKEGIDMLNLNELQQACRARGMRAYGVPEKRLRSQLAQWLDLSLNKKVPPSLLLLSRALMLPETIPTEDKLKATISALPEAVITQTSQAIGEKEGKILNKVKIEVLREEERKIKEERKEVSEEKKKEVKKEIKEQLVDKAPIIEAAKTPELKDTAKIVTDTKVVDESKIATKDLEAIEGALEEMSKEKLIVEKEVLSELKTEMADYQEDVQDFKEAVADLPKQDMKVSRASKVLYKKVNKMINKMDAMVAQLEHQKEELSDKADTHEEEKERLLKIEDIVNVIKKIKNVDDEVRLENITKVLRKMDDDCDGSIDVEDVLKVIEFIGKDSIKLSDKQVDELIDLMNKEEILEVEDKIEKALKKDMKEGEKGDAASKGEPSASEKKPENAKSSTIKPNTKVEANASPKIPSIPSIEPAKKKSDSKML